MSGAQRGCTGTRKTRMRRPARSTTKWLSCPRSFSTGGRDDSATANNRTIAGRRTEGYALLGRLDRLLAARLLERAIDERAAEEHQQRRADHRPEAHVDPVVL